MKKKMQGILSDMNKGNITFDDGEVELLNLFNVTNSALKLKVKKLESDNKLLQFMVDNGINEEEMYNSNDITMPQEI